MAKLYLVSTGPGAPGLMAPDALAAVAASQELVAYGYYLDLLGEAAEGKTHHALALGEETERARLALNLAAEGKHTALVSSGDIGIYAMAALVFEMLDRQLQGEEAHPGWLDVDIEIVPGISAMQLASSRAGALLGHDFCTISLSDLLTPWETIEARLHSAGSGDFVISLYNPRSQKRDWQLGRARDILLGYRSETTPVVLGQQLGRPTETLQHTTLGGFELEAVDMFTVVCIGNSESRAIRNGEQQWVYTPRGYRKKL